MWVYDHSSLRVAIFPSKLCEITQNSPPPKFEFITVQVILDIDLDVN